MSGHSKWANIRHKKGKSDAARGKIFTKLGREIVVAVKQGGADPNSNSKLADAIAKARANNMPNDTITRSIKKASGELEGVTYEEIVYEGYGAGGVAIVVEAVTDNRNRTASDIRHIFDKYGGSMGATNCVMWMFDKKGELLIEKTPKMNEDEVMMNALEAGASDIIDQGDVYEVITAPEDFSAVRQALEKCGYSFLSAEVEMIPQTTVDIKDVEAAGKINRMIEMLEDNDDVQNVYHNANLPEEPEEE